MNIEFLPRSKLVNDLSNSVVQMWIVFSFRSCIAQKAFLLFQMRHDAKTFRLDQPAR